QANGKPLSAQANGKSMPAKAGAQYLRDAGFAQTKRRAAQAEAEHSSCERRPTLQSKESKRGAGLRIETALSSLGRDGVGKHYRFRRKALRDRLARHRRDSSGQHVGEFAAIAR